MSFKPFFEKYGELHARMQEDVELVRRIYSFADRLHPLIDYGYHSTGLEFEGTPLGIMVGRYDRHIDRRMAFMHLLYDVSEGRIDLSKITVKLDDELGFVTEDMSNNEAYEIESKCPFEELDPTIVEVFDESRSGRLQLLRTTFLVRKEGEVIRRPVVDLEGLFPKKAYLENSFTKIPLFSRQFPDEFRLKRV